MIINPEQRFLPELLRPPIIGSDGRIYKYRLAETYQFETGLKGRFVSMPFLILEKSGRLTLLAGYIWDGPSGTALDTMNFMRASAGHDGWYQLTREGILSIKDRPAGDSFMRRLAAEDGMTKWRRWKSYFGVRLFGRGSAKKRR